MSAGRSYYEEHKEQITQYMREYRTANASFIARKQRSRYAENKAKLAESQRWIKKARMRMGWSQKGLGEAVGVGQSTIARLETGACPLERFRKRDKLLEVLGVQK